MKITPIEFIHSSSNRIIAVHQIWTNPDSTNVIAPMQNMDSFCLHDIIHPLRHVITAESGIGFKVWDSSSHIGTTQHGFVNTIKIESIGIIANNIGTGLI